MINRINLSMLSRELKHVISGYPKGVTFGISASSIRFLIYWKRTCFCSKFQTIKQKRGLQFKLQWLTWAKLNEMVYY